MKNTIILIGGAPTAGKSTVAQLLSERLKIPWISTDQIRELMLHTVRKEDYPVLFRKRDYTAEQFLTTYSAEDIVKKEMEEGEATWIGVQAFIRHEYPWESFIVEGVAVLPRLVKRDLAGDFRTKCVFLIDEDADRIRDVVFKRGLWDDASSYSDGVKEKEIDWVLRFSQELKEEAERYGYPCLEVQKQHEDIGMILTTLGLAM